MKRRTVESFDDNEDAEYGRGRIERYRRLGYFADEDESCAWATGRDEKAREKTEEGRSQQRREKEREHG